MKLIEYDGVDFKIADEALLVRPIRALFRADKSKKKEELWKQLGYLWFMCDPRSPYMYLTDEDARADEVKKQEGFEDNWKPSALLREAMTDYKALSVTTSALLLEDVRFGIDNVRKFFRTADLTATDEKSGKPLYQVSSYTTALRQAMELSKMLVEYETQLAKDFQSENAARGSAEKAMYENI